MRYWLMKSEPDELSIDDLAAMPKKTTAWFGVRNYQARNFMRDQMHVGDLAFFYHSSCPEPGIAGIVRVSKAAYPDQSQFDRKSPYHDPKATRTAPRWLNVDVTLVRIVWVILAFTPPGAGVLGYLIAWLIIPNRGGPNGDERAATVTEPSAYAR